MHPIKNLQANIRFVLRFGAILPKDSEIVNAGIITVFLLFLCLY